MKSLIY